MSDTAAKHIVHIGAESPQPELHLDTPVDASTCKHAHSVTGDFGLVQRLLPEYNGGHPQPGYMLDICKICLKELPERPYNPSWPPRHH